MSRSQKRPANPQLTARAWARFRWIMRWVVATAMLSVAAALFYLWMDGSPLTVAVLIATSAGVSLTVLLGGALMGLVFMSAGTGHDAEVGRPEEQDDGSTWDRRR